LKAPRCRTQHEKVQFQEALQMQPIISLLEFTMRPTKSINTEHIQKSQQFGYILLSPHKNQNLTRQYPTHTKHVLPKWLLSKSLMNFIIPLITDP